MRNVGLNTMLRSQREIAAKNANGKLYFYDKLLTYCMRKIQLPYTLILSIDTEKLKPGDDTIAYTNFNLGDRISLVESRFNNTNSIQYLRTGITVYHELRHAEQLFRGLQYYAQKEAGITVDIGTAKTPKIIVVDKSKLKPGSKIISKDEAIKRMQLGLNIWQNAKTKPIPENLEGFAKIMSDAIVKNNLIEESRKDGDRTRIVERDAYNFSLEGYILLNKPRLSPEESFNSWNPGAFKNILVGNPSGYIDKYAGKFSERIILSDKAKYPLISVT